MITELLYRTEVWAAIFVLILFYAVAAALRKRSSLEPPGPWGLPVVGYMPFLGKKMNLTINQLAKKYGDVFQLKIGSRKVVVISGQKRIREAMMNSGTTFAGRPDFYSYVVVKNFGFADFSPSVRLYKKHTLKAFGQFTRVRRRELEQVAHNAVFMLIKEFQKAKNQPIDPKPPLYKVTCTIMGYICYGKFFDADDEEISTILSKSENFGKYVAFGIICDFLPWAKFLMRKQLRSFEELLNHFTSYSDKLAAVHIESYDGETMRDMSDMFRKVAEEMDENERKELNVNETMLKKHVSTLFGAGFGTISGTLQYGFMIMALHPEVQKRVQNELDHVIGKDRYPEFEDENDLPYTAATVAEIYRHHSMSALGVTHSTTCDTNFAGYFIPKNTPVIINLYSANRDETIFADPEKFNPERFLTEDGKCNAALTEYVVPYGLGHRRCAGEPVARLEVFLFLATILQQCTIKESPEHPLDLDDYIMGFGIMHKHFKLIFLSRNEEW